MATNAYGVDFWIGRIFRSKDPREEWRHVVITEIRGGGAKCHNLLTGEPGKMSSRGSWISLKGLATRWKTCPNRLCTKSRFCTKRVRKSLKPAQKGCFTRETLYILRDGLGVKVWLFSLGI